MARNSAQNKAINLRKKYPNLVTFEREKIPLPKKKEGAFRYGKTTYTVGKQTTTSHKQASRLAKEMSANAKG